MTLDNLKIGKMYLLNKRAAIYMGMISDLSAPLHGFPLFILDDGFVRAMKKTDEVTAYVALSSASSAPAAVINE